MMSSPPPPRDALAVPVRVERVPRDATWRIVVTSHRAAQVWTHYIDRRTRPCPSPHTPCIHCETGTHRQWEAYVSAYVQTLRMSMVLVIPALCWIDLQPKLASLPDIVTEGRMEKDLRGVELTLRRPGTDKRGRLYADVERMPYAGDRVPAGLNVPVILSRMWQLGDRQAPRPR